MTLTSSVKSRTWRGLTYAEQMELWHFTRRHHRVNYILPCVWPGSLEGLSHLSSPLCFFFLPVFNKGPQSCLPCSAAEANLDPQSLDSWPQGLLSTWPPPLLIWHRSCPFAFGLLFSPSCWDHLNAVAFLDSLCGELAGKPLFMADSCQCMAKTTTIS